jgi:integrase/recombinase XerD
VAHLRKMMLEVLQRRNYAENTTCRHIQIVEDFSGTFNCPPDGLGPKHTREYQAELFTKRELTASTVPQYLAAMRFFYIKTLQRPETPYPKKVFAPPTILSQEEVAGLIEGAFNSYGRTVPMTLYAHGLRRAVLTRPESH